MRLCGTWWVTGVVASGLPALQEIWDERARPQAVINLFFLLVATRTGHPSSGPPAERWPRPAGYSSPAPEP